MFGTFSSATTVWGGGGRSYEATPHNGSKEGSGPTGRWRVAGSTQAWQPGVGGGFGTPHGLMPIRIGEKGGGTDTQARGHGAPV
jgi:hypothetical protein